MISGGIFYGGRTELEVLDKTGIKINSDVYLKTVKNIYEPALKKHNLIFQQDNAPSHSAKATKAYFLTKDYIVLKWPAISCDLNPIETIWKLVKDKLRMHIVKSRDELIATIHKIWLEID